MMLLEVLFYWYFTIITATTGGKVYATGDWRMPLSDEDYGDQIEARWVIAGEEARSSCYAWGKADEGYHFAGFFNASNEQVASGEKTNEVRIWTTTESAQQEDGIVSGNDLYPTTPQTFTAVFLPDDVNDINSIPEYLRQQQEDDVIYDLAGRKMATPRGGQIIVRNRKKLLLTR